MSKQKWGLWYTKRNRWAVDRNGIALFDSIEAASSSQMSGSWDDDAELEAREYTNSVSSPAHYTAFPGIEVIQLTRNLNFNRGNAVKYLARAGKRTKDGEPGPTVQGDLEDIKKALWYVADECQRLGVSAGEIAHIVAPHSGHK